MIIDAIHRWPNETPGRVPLTDWYDTKTGKQVGFHARSVVGGVFIKALSDAELTAKWRAEAQKQSNIWLARSLERARQCYQTWQT